MVQNPKKAKPRKPKKTTSQLQEEKSNTPVTDSPEIINSLPSLADLQLSWKQTTDNLQACIADFLQEEFATLYNKLSDMEAVANHQFQDHFQKIESISLQLTDVQITSNTQEAKIASLNHQLETNTQDIMSLKKQNEDLQLHISVLTNQLEIAIDPNHRQATPNQDTICDRLLQCELDLENQENYSRRECLVITRLPPYAINKH